MLSKSQARTFFIAGTAICSLSFIGLTVDTFQRIPAQTNAAGITDQVIRGKKIWEANNCMGCHNADGKGQKDIFPPLNGNPVVRQSSAETLARVVLAGTQAADVKAAPTQPAMPSFAWRLDDQQVADVLTYVRSNWGGAAQVTAGTVRTVRAGLARENRAR